MRRVFGPVPSRRLGKSLGVNNIPAKFCSYSCVYCQLGRTTELTVERRKFYPPEELIEEVRGTLGEVEEVDYITFVPDGEPTLDLNIRMEAEMIREFSNKRLAILTNSSLLHRDDVREDLMEFDLVSVKVDAVEKGAWRRINRPHPRLELEKILEGVRKFAKSYGGELISETMLLKGMNTEDNILLEIAEFLSEASPRKVYLTIPTRPPAEPWVKGAREEEIFKAHQLFEEIIGRDKVQLLTGYESSSFTLTGDPVEAFLSIISVHPMRLDYAHRILEEKGLNPDKVIDGLLREGKIKLMEYEGVNFIIRRLPSPRDRCGAAGN